MKHPGDLTDQERQAVFEQMRAAATDTFGPERAALLERSLGDISTAVGRLGKVRFSRDDAPGFYLNEPPNHEQTGQAVESSER